MFPVVLMLAAFSFFYVTRIGIGERFYGGYLALLVGVAFISGVAFFIIVGRFLKTLGSVGGVNQNLEILKKRNEILLQKNRSLSIEVELLSAMRNISLIVSEDVNFDSIFEKILKIVDELMEAVEITIYSADTPGGRLSPIAHRQDDKTLFGKQIQVENLDNSLVEEVWKHHTCTPSAQDDYLTFTTLLEADFDKVGILKVTLRLEGERDEREAMAEQYEAFIKGLSKHIALAIKTTVLHNKAIVDGLTHLHNRAHFRERLDQAVAQSERQKSPLSIIMIDIDHFKSVNDTYGHQVGDDVLIGVARILEKNMRRYDSAYRYGGEELAVLLPTASLANGLNLAERMRTKIESHRFKDSSGKLFKVTASFGVAELAFGLKTQEELVEAADKALYLAKEQGRNQVRTVQKK